MTEFNKEEFAKKWVEALQSDDSASLCAELSLTLPEPRTVEESLDLLFAIEEELKAVAMEEEQRSQFMKELEVTVNLLKELDALNKAVSVLAASEDEEETTEEVVASEDSEVEAPADTTEDGVALAEESEEGK